jgi:shikimate dehydrogenase
VIGRPGRLVLLGRSLSHSLSPRFQNAALAHEGIGGGLRYEVLDIPLSALDTTLESLALVNGAGNVTVPYKERVFERCDRLTPLARRVGAVNTFWFERGELVGDNTDVGGVHHAVVQLMGSAPRAATVGVLGAGGAAAAVLAAAEAWPECAVLVANRTPERADVLCARFPALAQRSDVDRLVREAELVVNATSVGLRDDELPIDPDLLRHNAVVLDLVYRRGGTAWVRQARASGRPAADGLTMLVEQGALAFERWFGVQPDREVMWAAVR